MPEVQVGRRRIQPQLDPQRLARLLAAPQLGSQLLLDEQLVNAALDNGQRLLDGVFGLIGG